MKRKKAFTLVELLVVISIIALLLAVLVPALSRARDLAKRAACLSLTKSYGKANMIYASANDGWFVPFSQPHARPGYSWDERWPENREFRRNISVDARKAIEDGGWSDAFVWPKQLRCPAQKILDEEAYSAWILQQEGWEVIMSYGYNVEQWRGNGNLFSDATWWPFDGKYYGHHQSKIKKPSLKMMFIDNNYYQARYERANPIYWETYGDRVFMMGNRGQVCYRHNDGAVLVYFDGHSAYLKKYEVWDENNQAAPFDVRWRFPNELWDVGDTSDLIYFR